MFRHGYDGYMKYAYPAVSQLDDTSGLELNDRMSSNRYHVNHLDEIPIPIISV
jgi:hypothetical protein